MPRIVIEDFFDGAQRRIDRLGLSDIMDETRKIVTDWQLTVLEQRGANGGGALRELLDARFAGRKGWSMTKVGGIDWTRCARRRGTQICIGVEVQVSARSDLVAVDLLHINKAIRDGNIDLGVLIVPSDRLASFLPSRFPCVSESRRMLEMADARTIPLVFWGIEHDGPGAALAVRGRKTL